MSIKILQVCDVYPPSFSGYGKQLSTVNKQIALECPDAKIQTLTTYDKLFHNRVATQTSEGFSLFKCSRLESKFRLLKYFLFCVSLLAVHSNKIRRTDVVHVVKASYEFLVVSHLARIFRKPIIVKIVQSEIFLVKNSIVRTMLFNYKMRLLRSNNCYCVAISNEIYLQLLTLGVQKSNIVRIPNAVDVNRFTQATNSCLLEKKPEIDRKDFEKIVIYCGTISRRKGIHDFLSALEKKYFSSKTCILILGPNFGEVEDFFVRIDGLSKREDISIIYLGDVDCPEIYFGMADLLVLPSYAEGMPNVALEAMSSGLPLLLSDISVHLELVNYGAGRTFHLGDSSDLAYKMHAILDDPEFRNTCSLNGIEAARNIFAVSSVAKQYCLLYSSLSSSKYSS